MNPVDFQCTQAIPATAQVICDQIADTGRWSEFRGYGILPGVKSARYETRTGNMVGSRILVQNTDGSQHVEEIVTWIADRQISMRFREFRSPLRALVTHIYEDWHFQNQGDGTIVTRRIRIFPVNVLALPVVWAISLLFKKAIARNLREMADALTR